jgi:hypothetical protein
MEELAPYIEQAFARKTRMKALADDEIPNVIALGRQVAQQQAADPQAQAAALRFSEAGAVPLTDPAKKAPAAE